MSIAFNFNLMNRVGPIVPHLLVLRLNERTNRFSWSYFQIQGKIVPQGAPPKAAGDDVRYGLNQAVFDLYANGNPFGTLTLNKRISSLNVGEKGVFTSFTQAVYDATFTGRG